LNCRVEFLTRVYVYASSVSCLTCDVTIAAHARSSRADGRSPVRLLLLTHSFSQW